MNAPVINSGMSTKTSCSLSNCDQPARARGYCSKHYQRWKKHGDPNVSIQGQRPRQDDWDRFMSHVEAQGSGCWFWTSVRSPGGYGKFGITTEVGKRRIVTAHVWAWERVNGPRPTYPPGHRRAGKPLDLDHFKCSTPWCVNPEHVRPATTRENVLRGDTLQARNAAKTHCPQGHQYDEENTYVDPRGSRSCRKCMNAKRERYR